MESATSKEVIRTSDLVIADISYPSTGVGIELGWADCFNIRVIQNRGAIPRLSN